MSWLRKFTFGRRSDIGSRVGRRLSQTFWQARSYRRRPTRFAQGVHRRLPGFPAGHIGDCPCQ